MLKQPAPKRISGNSSKGQNGVKKDPNHSLKVAIWSYFFLVIFEGALRKWVVPALSTPLLVIRDPIALWLLVTAVRRNLVSFNIYMSGMIFLGIAAYSPLCFLGHGNFAIALYGARILALHFPLIFVIGKVFNRDDVIKMGKVTLLISIPMAVLIAMQFYSPQSPGSIKQ
jgi:prepilin signal peptidase PulO-like enzyme (type II secretory pathway)